MSSFGKKMKNQNNPMVIVILVTGVSGVGKSTFINSLLNRPSMPVGHGMDPCTKELSAVEIQEHKGHRVFIVDTPGFDNIYKQDSDVLKKIAVWLKRRWPKQSIDGGVIYLQNIQDDHHYSLAHTDLALLRCSFGMSQETLRRLVLATTKWHPTNIDKSERRRLDLEENKWKNLIESGTSSMKFERDCESAQRIVEILLQNCLGQSLNFDVKANLDQLMKIRANTTRHKTGWPFRRFFGLISPYLGF